MRFMHGKMCGRAPFMDMNRDAPAMFAMAGRGPGFGRGGPGGGRGFGDDGGEGRMGRFLGQGQIRFLVLHLIAEEPRHGYELIKAIEELSEGFYAPSPGVIYPTLSYLEEGGFVEARSDGNKKSYAITDEGKTYLQEHTLEAAMAVKTLGAIGERMRRKSERHERAMREQSPDLPRSADAALLNLREVIARRLDTKPGDTSEIVRELLDLAEKLEAD